MVQADHRLLLDLEHPVMVKDLHIELERRGEADGARLQEVLPDLEHLWLRDENNAPYFAEVVVPMLHNTTAPITTNNGKDTKPYPLRSISHKERLEPPGGRWTYLKLYSSFNQHDEIIAGPIRTLIQQLQQERVIDCWFYIRYADPRPHLRLRFHNLDEQGNGHLLPIALEWSRQLVEQGLLHEFAVDTYSREIERYGGPEAISILEQIFSASSAFISEIILLQYKKYLVLDPVVIAVLSLDLFFAAWGLDFTERLHWLESRIDRPRSRAHDFRPYRQLLWGLLASGGRSYDVAVVAQREQIQAVFTPQINVIEEAAQQIRMLAANKKLWGREEDLLASLCHMHINRLLGTNYELEEKTMIFWYRTLESLCLQSGSKKDQ